MKIIRIASYDDSRFFAAALRQHGCFLVDGTPYEVEIISDFEAVIRGVDAAVYPQVIDEFRFYAPRDMAPVSHAEYEERWNRFCVELPGSSD